MSVKESELGTIAEKGSVRVDGTNSKNRWLKVVISESEQVL